jgi:hypothetical protein
VGAGAAIWYQDAAGDGFVVPAVAVPYVGKQLSPSLFDVSALARDRITGGARIPVALRFAPGARVAAPPGVTLTWARGQVARGYVTAASGRRLGTALAQQNGADTVGGHLTAVGRLFGGLTAMTLAAPGAPAAPHRPDYPLHTLRLKVTDETGRPANNTQVLLMNTDKISRESVSVPVSNGVARLAVPAGDYSLWGFFEDLSSKGVPTAFRHVLQNDFRVPATRKTTTVTLAERSATSGISVTAPRPARTTERDQLFERTSTAPGSFGFGFLDGWPGVTPTYVNPQPAAKVGQLRYLVRWTGGPGRRDSFHGYAYEAAFVYPNIPADEHLVVRAGQVATVHEHFSADPAARGPGVLSDAICDTVTLCGGRSPAGPVVPFEFFNLLTVAVPGNLTLYTDTPGGDQWVQNFITRANPPFISMFADPHAFAAGHTYAVNWAHVPLAPGLGQHTGPWVCQACTAGRTLSLGFSALGDSEPDHFTLPIWQQKLFRVPPKASALFTLYRGGTKLLSTSKAASAVVSDIPARPSTYRAVLDVSLAGVPGFSQSTRTHTDLRVRYLPGAGAALPAGDKCAGQSAGSPCLILPALTLGYQFATNEKNTSGSKTQVLHLRVGHVSYNGAGSPAPITSAAVWVSFNSGKSWQQATVTGSAGDYTATWPNPASARGSSPEIKVIAADAAGGSITQTITAAYTIAAPSQHRSPR